MGKASLSVAILPGANKSIYKVQASSRDGRTPYEGFASAVGVTIHHDQIKGETPVKVGTYNVKGIQRQNRQIQYEARSRTQRDKGKRLIPP